MPLKNYGVWVGYPRRYVAEKDKDTPHLQLYFTDRKDQDQGKFRAAINIKSSTPENARLAYWFVREFRNPITQDLEGLEDGWRDLKAAKKSPALDYIRGNLFNPMTGTLLDHDRPGEKNDIIDFVSPILDEAIKRKAKVYLYGEQFPGGNRSAEGIHDVHMNQGNDDEYAKFNGVFQDGGVLFRFPDDGHWEAIFLAFAVQKIHTDDQKGHPITDKSLADILKPLPGGVDRAITIRAALINPVGPDETPSGQPEAVHLFNTTSSDINLNGWSIINREKETQALSGVLRSNKIEAFTVEDCPLTNKGGTITLLNADKLKVDGVSYTKAQAKQEGRLVWFQ
jgi:uncharacterized protein YukJ